VGKAARVRGRAVEAAPVEDARRAQVRRRGEGWACGERKRKEKKVSGRTADIEAGTTNDRRTHMAARRGSGPYARGTPSGTGGRERTGRFCLTFLPRMRFMASVLTAGWMGYGTTKRTQIS
jgi:hypothetical protein